eukprot:6196227-Pleurochrysis_carterae.AAC.2
MHAADTRSLSEPRAAVLVHAAARASPAEGRRVGICAAGLPCAEPLGARRQAAIVVCERPRWSCQRGG